MRYQIDLPYAGRNQSVTYEVSAEGTITLEKVDGVEADLLPVTKKEAIIEAIKNAPHPGNELPEGEAGTKPVDPDAPEAGQDLPGRNPNLNPDLDPDVSRPDVPDNALPEGPPDTAGNELPEAPEPKA